jgi:hypothetical protein
MTPIVESDSQSYYPNVRFITHTAINGFLRHVAGFFHLGFTVDSGYVFTASKWSVYSPLLKFVWTLSYLLPTPSFSFSGVIVINMINAIKPYTEFIPLSF